MRSAIITLLVCGLVAGLCLATVIWEQRDNASRVVRAQGIVRELERVEIGKTKLSVADEIAKKFGNAPVPEGWTEYPKKSCASPERTNNCVYMFSMNNSRVESLLLKHSWLRRVGLRDWWGYAEIIFADGTASQYLYWVWYKAPNGQWRGAGARVGKTLPQYVPFQARISNSYSVERTDMPRNEGFLLQSSLTPNATAKEWQRASHIDFTCLKRKQGCGELPEIMPEAWQDFYLNYTPVK